MTQRVLGLSLIVVALVLFTNGHLLGDDKGKGSNTHTGTFVNARGTSFTMTVKGKEHSHNLAKNAEVRDAEGKECKIDDFKKGQRIRVTTEPDDKKIATKVEALKGKL